MRQLVYALCVLSCALPLIPLSAQSNAKDIKGSSDHPLFPKRMPGYSISNYKQQEFDKYQFRTKPPKMIEGKHTYFNYYLLDAAAHPGALAIQRNYGNAIKAVGGEVVYSDNTFSILKANRSGTEVWTEVQAGPGRSYYVHIVEREAMQQVITADAMSAAIDKDGFIALDIHFATAKADILPESKPIIDEIVAMLKKRATLKVGVEGHTDNTGTPAGNRTLSDARAKSVAAALTTAGIPANRLTPAGFGQDKPVAGNRTEEGRAKNRRVEIVKKN